MTKVFIIAEAGVNHNGRIDLALKLVDQAVQAGADAVKFQTGIPEMVATSEAEKADYQKKNTGNKKKYFFFLPPLIKRVLAISIN